MEKEQDLSLHLPFPSAKISSIKEFLKEINRPAGDYKLPGKPNNLVVKFVSELNDFSEEIIGPASIFEYEDYFYLPPRWRYVADYLQNQGLLKQVITEPFFNDEPKLNRFALQTPFDGNLTDGHELKRDIYCHGDSLDFDEAMSKAFGEFLERYSLAIYREDKMLKASWKEAKKRGGQFLNINNLAGYSKKQKEDNPNFQFNENSQFYWVVGQNLFNKKSIMLPAQMVFWNYDNYHENWREPILRERNTNGAGGHCSLTEAILSGLYELIQRDGFMIYWLNHQAPPQIELSSIKNKETLSLLKQCQQMGFEVYFFNTTSELGVPACICSLVNNSSVSPKFSLGGGCGADWEKILLRSLVESLGCYHWLRKSHQNKEYFYIDEEKYKPFEDASVGQIERLSFWGNEKVFNHFQFFLEGKKQNLEDLTRQVPAFSSSQQELDYLTQKFQVLGKGYEIYYYQAKHQILDDLGYYSVRVIVPQLIYLYLNETSAPLGARRLKEVPPKLGFEAAKAFNPWPHPFP
jgi:ribosomal protein S12 methylthiotransferase accessory factor